jgi:hypothetical protein
LPLCRGPPPPRFPPIKKKKKQKKKKKKKKNHPCTMTGATSAPSTEGSTGFCSAESLLQNYEALSPAMRSLTQDFSALSYGLANDTDTARLFNIIFDTLNNEVENVQARTSELQRQLDAACSQPKPGTMQPNDTNVLITTLKRDLDQERARYQEADIARQAAEIRAQGQETQTASLRARLAQATSQRPTEPTTPDSFNTLSALPFKPRGAEPPMFSGDEKDCTQRQEEYTNWRTQCHIKMTLDRPFYPEKADRILYIAQHLTGTAFSLVRDRVALVAEHQRDPARWPTGWDDYTSILEHLNPSFITTDVVAFSRRELQKHRQGRMPYADFIAMFVKHADASQTPDRQRVDYLKEKINDNLKDALANQVNRPGDEDVPGWIAFLRKLSDNLADRRLAVGSAAPYNPGPTPSPAGDPMDLGKVSATPGKGPVSTAEKDRRRRNRLCHYCGENGHFVLNCPNKRWKGSTDQSGDTTQGKE